MTAAPDKTLTTITSDAGDWKRRCEEAQDEVTRLCGEVAEWKFRALAAEASTTTKAAQSKASKGWQDFQSAIADAKPAFSRLPTSSLVASEKCAAPPFPRLSAERR